MQPRNPLIRKKSFFKLMSDSKKTPKTRATAHGPKETAQTSSNTTGGAQKLPEKKKQIFQSAPTGYKVESSIDLNKSRRYPIHANVDFF